MSKSDFVALVTADQPDAPPYFLYDAVLNAKERLTLDETLKHELNPMTLDLALALQRNGGQIVDVPVVDRREPATAVGLHRQRDCGRNCGMGNCASFSGVFRPLGARLASARNVSFLLRVTAEREQSTPKPTLALSPFARPGYQNPNHDQCSRTVGTGPRRPCRSRFW